MSPALGVEANPACRQRSADETWLVQQMPHSTARLRAWFLGMHDAVRRQVEMFESILHPNARGSEETQPIWQARMVRGRLSEVAKAFVSEGEALQSLGQAQLIQRLIEFASEGEAAQ